MPSRVVSAGATARRWIADCWGSDFYNLGPTPRPVHAVLLRPTSLFFYNEGMIRARVLSMVSFIRERGKSTTAPMALCQLQANTDTPPLL